MNRIQFCLTQLMSFLMYTTNGHLAQIQEAMCSPVRGGLILSNVDEGIFS